MTLDRIKLTTIGSRKVRVDVQSSALAEAGPGAKTLRLELYSGPLSVTFTREEAQWLADRLSGERDA